MEEQKNTQLNPDTEQEKTSAQPETLYSDTDFMREKIKQRPVSKRRLLHNTMITVGLAIVFGVVACLTFFLLFPLANKVLNPDPEQKPEIVSLPENPVAEEIPPEELIADDTETASLEEPQSPEETGVETIIAAYPFGVDEYTKLFSSLKKVAQDSARSLVTVTLLTDVSDKVSADLEAAGSKSGVVIADNAKELLILCEMEEPEKAEKIRVTFNDGEAREATFLSEDKETGLAIIGVKHTLFNNGAENNFPPMTLGSSSSTYTVGQPCIAVGFAAGTPGSLAYGMITANSKLLTLTDATYALLSTNIPSVPSGSGVLINLKGELLGIFSPSLLSRTNAESGSQMTAYGISSVRTLVENLSNGRTRAYLGINGAEVPQSVRDENEIPAGAYVTGIEMNAPAMTAGVQPGDVITAVGTTEITNYGILSNVLFNYEPGEQVKLTVMRQGQEGYTEVILEVTFARQ